MNGQDKIGEVRGVLQHQALEPQFNDILEDKLSEFGQEADKYKKKSEDMKHMTLIEHKTNNNEPLSKSELEFLYEINSTIEGFGYQKDPRIGEIREKRNKTEDALVIFECTQDQLATSKEQVNENTKAYIGEWNPSIYQTIKNYPNITHLYESFPDKKIFTFELKTDSTIQTPEQAEEKIKEKGMFLDSYAEYNLVSFSVEQLGFTNGAKLKEIYSKAKELGLEVCPAEVGPRLRLQYQNQPESEYLKIAMEAVPGRYGSLLLFDVNRRSGKSWLYYDYGRPGGGWRGSYRFVFLSRKS
jgi:hypothetical protein